MYNDFVIVGPDADPAGVRRFTEGPAALRKIAAAGAGSVSRGDDTLATTRRFYASFSYRAKG